jgi:hypothetical protein
MGLVALSRIALSVAWQRFSLDMAVPENGAGNDEWSTPIFPYRYVLHMNYQKIKIAYAKRGDQQ